MRELTALRKVSMGQMFSAVAHLWSQAADLISMILGLTGIWLATAAYRRQNKLENTISVHIDVKAERALRVALSSVARGQTDQIEAALAGLDDRERAEALALVIRITRYVSVDACGSTWPTDTSVRRIAKSLATVGTLAKRLQLSEDEIYTYLARVVLGSKRLEDVIPDKPQRTRLPVIVTERALAVLSPKELGLREYLDRIESAIESASALDETVLAAAVMRAYMPRSEAFFQFHQDVHADDDAQKVCGTQSERSSEA